jgi:hypothetical protein
MDKNVLNTFFPWTFYIQKLNFNPAIIFKTGFLVHSVVVIIFEPDEWFVPADRRYNTFSQTLHSVLKLARPLNELKFF